MAIPTPDFQADVNTRGRTDNTFYDHINSSVMTATASPTVGGSGNGQYLTFNGTTQYVQTSLPASLASTFADSQFTLSARFKTTSTGIAAFAHIFGFNNSADTRRVNILLSNTNGNVAGGFDVPTGTDVFFSSTTEGDDTNWHVLTLRRDGTDMSMWIDGTEVDTDTTTPGTMGTLNELCIARRGGTSDNWYLPGSVQWVAVWESALTDAQIQELDDIENPFVVAISASTSTPSPTTAITITKTNGNWLGTPTATLGGNAMPALTSVTSNTAVLTLGAGSIANYDDTNATWELIRWNTALNLVVTDNSVQSNAVSITIQPPTLDHFDQLAGGVFDYAPGASADNDDCYVYITTGDGEGLPKIAGFQGNTVPSTVRFMVFDVSGAKWLAHVEKTFDTAQQLLSGDTADSFTETSDTALSSHTPDTDAVGNGWTIEADNATNPAPSAGTVMVIGSTDRLTITANTAGGSIDLGTTDMDVSWDYISGTSTGEEWTAYLRRVDGNNGTAVYVRRSTNMIRVINRVSGVGTALTNTINSGANTPYTFANSTSYSFRAVVDGQDLNVYVNDALVGTYVIPTTPAANATRFGLYSSVASPTYPIYFDNMNAVTGYVAPSNTVSTASPTVVPGGTISGTASGAFAGAITAVYLADVALSVTASTTTTFSATCPALAQFDANGTAAAIEMNVPQVLRVTDGTTERTTTITVTPPVPANFGQTGDGPFTDGPDGLQPGDDVLAEVVSGDGTFSPESSTFSPVQNSTVNIRAFNHDTGRWLEYVEVTAIPIVSAFFLRRNPRGGPIRTMHRRA